MRIWPESEQMCYYRNNRDTHQAQSKRMTGTDEKGSYEKEKGRSER
jgi:hypothetical protein